MLSILWDLNFSSLLCYVDDLLVLDRLKLVFQRLRQPESEPKEMHIPAEVVRFLGHVINDDGMAVDPTKVDVKSKMKDLMEKDLCMP